MDIYCKKGICLICGSKLKKVHPTIRFKPKVNIPYFCSNGCYKMESWGHMVPYKAIVHYESRVFTIFGEVYTFSSLHSREEKKKVKKNLIERIEYLKKDYRYLAEILERS